MDFRQEIRRGKFTGAINDEMVLNLGRGLCEGVLWLLEQGFAGGTEGGWMGLIVQGKPTIFMSKFYLQC